MKYKYKELVKIPMRKDPFLTEKWVQDLLTKKPGLLGFGDLEVREVERLQRGGGRLDILLIDPDSLTRYEVELQLGATDESHIIRTLEYWDIERRRYPQYEHIAVIVAEEITSRFFNVISLFNGFIPIVAIQMTALRVDDDHVSLVFTKVMDHTVLGTDEEDQGEPVNREFWEDKSSPDMLKLVDRIHNIVKEGDRGMELNYTKYYIGLHQSGKVKNYVQFNPIKRRVTFSIKLPHSEEVDSMIEEADIETLPYDNGFGYYRIKIYKREDVDEYRDLLRSLIAKAKDSFWS